MIHKTFLSLFCFCLVLCASAQFTWSNPQPSGWSNTKVVFTGSTIGYIINNNGDLIKTTNGGTNWNIIKNFPRCSALDVKDSFLVAGGADTTIYFSTDSAKSWKKGLIRQTEIIEKIQIISKDTVFALSKNFNIGTSQLYRSVNGGLTWQLINGSFIIKGLDFINSRLGYATSFGGVFKTTDGGATWQQVYNQNSGYSFTTVKFINNQTGFATQDLGIVIKTTDGGANWSTCLASTYGVVYSIAFANAATVFLAGEDGTLYRSTDAGATWQFKYNHIGDRYNLYSVYFINATTGFFVGLRGQIFRTTDGGDSYTDYAPTYIDVKPISFPTPSTGYAGMRGDLFKTINGGQSWSKLSVAVGTKWFQHLHFFSKDTGLALAESPVEILKTYNGGQSWLPVTLPLLYKDYIRGFFVLGNTIYLNINGAYGSSMLYSKDRGESWRSLSLNTTSNQQNLFFVDDKTGYGTQGPSLYKTIDSGKTWLAINLYNSYSYTLNSVFFTSPATGYVVGDQRFNLSSNDSGKTWTPFEVADGNTILGNAWSIRFFDKKVGYLTSDFGGIYKTLDAGKTWMPEKQAPWDCKTIHMTPDTSLFIGGLYGVILKKDMREYGIDSLKALIEGSCTARISARITAALSSIDSIWFEYGISGFTKAMLANPSQVKDSSIKTETLLQDLEGGNLYQFRIKIYYRGTYYYSDPVSFRPAGGLVKPAISFNGTLLLSSAAAGNQWFLNGAPVPGATGTTYQPVTQGIYTVQQKQAGCTSAMSDGFNFITTAIIDPVLTEALRILPNPVTTTLWIQNKQGRKLQIRLIDLWGRTLKTLQTAKTENTIDVQSLSAGIYMIFIEDVTAHKKTTAKLVKL